MTFATFEEELVRVCPHQFTFYCVENTTERRGLRRGEARQGIENAEILVV